MPGKSEPLLRELVTHWREKAGPESSQFTSQLAALGLNLLRQQKAADAEAVLRECLTIREKRQPDAWSTFNTMSMLGGSLLCQKDYAEAESLLLAGFRGMQDREAAIPVQGKSRLTEAVERLVELYDAWGKPDEAAEWRKRLEESNAKQNEPKDSAKN